MIIMKVNLLMLYALKNTNFLIHPSTIQTPATAHISQSKKEDDGDTGEVMSTHAAIII